VKTLLISVVFLLAVSITASADNGLVTVPSKYSVAETIDRFEAAAKAEKFQIFTRVDFQPLAAANGGNVRPNQLLIFGRGGVLPPLLPSTPMVAIDLPAAKEPGARPPVSMDDPPLTPGSGVESFRRYGSSSKPR